MDNTRHTANFLASLFFRSKYSLKYELDVIDIGIVRYVCDTLDNEYKRRGAISIELSFGQIATYTRISERTIKRRWKNLNKLKILKIVNNGTGTKCTFSVGRLVEAHEKRFIKEREMNKVEAKVRQKRGLRVTALSNNEDVSIEKRGLPVTLPGTPSHPTYEKRGLPVTLSNNKASNNITNKEKAFLMIENQKPKTDYKGNWPTKDQPSRVQPGDYKGPAPTATKPSPMVEEFMRKKGIV